MYNLILLQIHLDLSQLLSLELYREREKARELEKNGSYQMEMQLETGEDVTQEETKEDKQEETHEKMRQETLEEKNAGSFVNKLKAMADRKEEHPEPETDIEEIK